MRSKWLFYEMVLLAAAVFLSAAGCAQVGAPRVKAPGELRAESENVFDVLKNKPAWLYPAGACPADVVPAPEREVRFSNKDCKNGPLACLQDCEKGDAASCYALANFVQQAKGVGEEAAEALFSRSCKLGVVSGCTNKAAGLFNAVEAGAAGEDEKRCAAKAFEKTCERDDPWGCTMFGLVLTDGIGRERDLDLALKALAKSYQPGREEQPACQNAKALEKQISEIKDKEKK